MFMARNTRTLSRAGALGILLTALGSVTVSPPAEAVPAFTRQMGVGCNTCHYQHFPLLNSFGRAFKASGFTMSGTSNIESNHFSLPSTLNAALLTNIRFQKTNGTKTSGSPTSNNGEWIIPGETSLFIGGRVSENVGGLVEGDIGGAGAAAGAGFLASLKLPFVYQVGTGMNVGVVPFTSGLGPAYAFEVLNTGAVGNHVMTLVHPTAVSAQQYVQVGAGTTYNDYGGDAEGIGVFAATGSYFVTAAKWSPNHIALNTDSAANATPTANYLRAALTPTFGGWDWGFGVQYMDGESAFAGPPLDRVRTKAYAVDAQMQGDLKHMPLGVYLSYAAAPETSTGETPNLYNPNPKRKHALSLAGELGAFSEGRGTLELAYRWADGGQATDSSDNAATVAVTYLLSQNVQMALLHTEYMGDAHDSGNPAPLPIGGGASGSGDQLTSVNLAVAF